MKRKIGFICAVLVCIIIPMISHAREKYTEWKKDNCGIPDVVSSMIINDEHHLTVVANSGKIDDEEAFACELIEMCRDNAFHTIKFSTDINSYPSRLDISVYLKQSDIGKHEPVCRIRYEPLEYNEDYDIKNNADQYHLYLDDEEIILE